MNFNTQKADWNPSDKLLQIVKKIEVPLASIIEANSKEKLPLKHDVIFSNSREIQMIVDEILKAAKGKATLEKDPIIFNIYDVNERVQSMCKEKINPKKICKQDILWLVKMEEEVYKKIDQRNLNLYDLSYSLSVSERQLHRKTKNLLHLTPNKYIRVLKLHKAKQIIDNYLYDSISQISYAVGYYDTHYFSKLFNQQYGLTPKELLLNIQD